MMRLLLAFFGILLVGTSTLASCHVVRHRAVAAVVVEKKAVVAAVAAFVPVPVYAAVYTPPAVPVVPAAPAAPATAPAASQSVAGDLAAVLAELKRLSSRLDALERGGSRPETPLPAPGAPAPGAAGKVPAVFQSKCAACHEAKVAGEKGGGFLMFDGTALTRLSEKQWRKVATMTYSGRMPPKSHGTLSDAEVAEIMAYLDALK